MDLPLITSYTAELSISIYFDDLSKACPDIILPAGPPTPPGVILPLASKHISLLGVINAARRIGNKNDISDEITFLLPGCTHNASLTEQCVTMCKQLESTHSTLEVAAGDVITLRYPRIATKPKRAPGSELTVRTKRLDAVDHSLRDAQDAPVTKQLDGVSLRTNELAIVPEIHAEISRKYLQFLPAPSGELPEYTEAARLMIPRDMQDVFLQVDLFLAEAQNGDEDRELAHAIFLMYKKLREKGV